MSLRHRYGAHTAADLELVERIVVDGFPLELSQPRRPGVVFPPALLATCALYLARIDGEPAGACLVVSEAAAVGVYWVTTVPAFRSRGVGRALMHAILREYDDRPMTLTASRFGRPLYESLRFRTLTEATWWA